MGHNTARKGYEKLVDRLNKFPLGAPPSETLYKILNVMFSEEEALLVSKLPIKPFTAATASKAWKKSVEESSEILNELASRALLIDVEVNGNAFSAEARKSMSKCVSGTTVIIGSIKVADQIGNVRDLDGNISFVLE